MTKPFSFDELFARTEALLRRRSGNATSLVTLDTLTLDIGTKIVRRSGNLIALSATEFRLLEYLVLNKEQVLSETKLLEHVWDRNYA